MTSYETAPANVNRPLYYAIRVNNVDNTIESWMQHILAYLTNADGATAAIPNVRQERQQLENRSQVAFVCDGSCDCQTSDWLREVSYEEQHLKLLTSRINAGDTNLGTNSVDEDSLRREALVVIESMNRASSTVAETTHGLRPDADEPMDVDASTVDDSDELGDWDSDVDDSEDGSDGDDDDDSTYVPLSSSESELASSDIDTSDEEEAGYEEDNLSSCTYSYRGTGAYRTRSYSRLNRQRPMDANYESSSQEEFEESRWCTTEGR